MNKKSKTPVQRPPSRIVPTGFTYVPARNLSPELERLAAGLLGPRPQTDEQTALSRLTQALWMRKKKREEG